MSPNETTPPERGRSQNDDRRVSASTVSKSLHQEYHGKLVPPGTSAVTKVLEYSALKGTPRAILVSIASFARPDGTFTHTPGERTIAHRADRSRRTVQRHLKPAAGYERLLDSGELEIPHRGGSRRGDTHSYFIALISKVEKGDIQLSPIPDEDAKGDIPAAKGDKSNAKGDIWGLKGDSHVSPTQVLTTGPFEQAFLQAKVVGGTSATFAREAAGAENLSGNDHHPSPAAVDVQGNDDAASPSVGQQDADTSPDNSSGDGRGWTEADAKANALLTAKSKRMLHKVPR